MTTIVFKEIAKKPVVLINGKYHQYISLSRLEWNVFAIQLKNLKIHVMQVFEPVTMSLNNEVIVIGEIA